MVYFNASSVNFFQNHSEISPTLSPEVAMLRRRVPANPASRGRSSTSGYIQTEATVEFRRKLAREDFRLRAELIRLERVEEEHIQGYDKLIRNLKDTMNQIETRTLPLKDIDLITKRHLQQDQEQEHPAPSDETQSLSSTFTGSSRS